MMQSRYLNTANRYTQSIDAMGFAPYLNDTNVDTLQKNVSSLERLEPAVCMRAYGQNLIFGRASVLAVSNSTKAASNSSVTGFTYISPTGYDESTRQSDPLSWICSWLPGFEQFPKSLCNVGEAVKDADSWVVLDQPVDYCLSQKVPETCELQWSQTTMVVVIVCNIIKLLCMALFLYYQPEDHLVTVG